MPFRPVSFPGVITPGLIPDDISLELPENSHLSPDRQHFLLFIPWKDTYINQVPADFKNFFLAVLPYLHVRTTDVHTAVSIGMMDNFLSGLSRPVNRRVVAIALCLHDAGWSKLSEKEISVSLGITGLKLTGTALGPKQKHAEKSVEIARRVLPAFHFNPPLTADDSDLIFKAVLYHDRPEAVAGSVKPMPMEVRVLADLDHLWTFTHENFWQDTLRKGVAPPEYLQNIYRDLDSCFVTPEGRNLARELLSRRSAEVDDWKRQLV